MSNLYPAIWSDYYAGLSPEDKILALKKGGFSYTELSLELIGSLLERGTDLEKTGREFKAFMDENDFYAPQAHLDFVKDLTNPAFQDKLKREIVLLQAMGVNNGVIHLNGASGEDQDVRREKNMKALQVLQEFVRGTDFTLCIENLNSPHYVRDGKRIMSIIEDMGYANLGVCLDTGHLNSGQVKEYTTETQREFILTSGKYLKALHINGNNGMSDQHMAPYAVRSTLNYSQVLEALYEINYDGLFNLEVDGEMTGNIPRCVLDLKLVYMKDMLDIMLAPDFLSICK